MAKIAYGFYLETLTFKEAKIKKKKVQRQKRLLENLFSLFNTVEKAPAVIKHG